MTKAEERYLEDNDKGTDILCERGSETAHRSATSVGVLPKWRLNRVRVYMARNIGEPLSLAELAAAAGLSRMHFAAQFRAATGMRPHDYLLHRRIAEAKMIMATTLMPLAQVALTVGFQTQSHFSTVFKRLTNETPAYWRKTQQNGSTSSGGVAARRWQAEAHHPSLAASGGDCRIDPRRRRGPTGICALSDAGKPLFDSELFAAARPARLTRFGER